MPGQWCSVCGCDLPTMRNGTVTKATRRIHNAGENHRAALRDQLENQRLQVQEYMQEYLRNSERQRLREKCHLLLVGIVATRLRAHHASMVNARLAWLLESQCLLRKLEDKPMEASLLKPTIKIIAETRIRLIANDSYTLVELIAEHM